jgi:uncharacterized protein with PIN domain
LLLLLFGTRRKPGSTAGEAEGGVKSAFQHCPLCGSPLEKGERVKAVLYPGNQDRMMDIYGCPHCYPPAPQVPRICPVCTRELSGREIVIARFFQVEVRRHVHVLGCSSCYRRKKS